MFSLDVVMKPGSSSRGRSRDWDCDNTLKTIEVRKHTQRHMRINAVLEGIVLLSCDLCAGCDLDAAHDLDFRSRFPSRLSLPALVLFGRAR